LRTEIFLREIVDRNPNELRLVFKNYPLSTACNKRIANDLHPMACKAAQAAYAAFLIGGSRSFLTYADLLYVHQRQLKSEPWIGLAKQTGLELQRFTLLMEPDSAADRKVREDVALGLELGLDATPEVFFEGKRIPQGLKGEDFVAALEELIRISHPEKKDLNLNR
jgi:protein-disulfide isomerase